MLTIISQGTRPSVDVPFYRDVMDQLDPGFREYALSVSSSKLKLTRTVIDDLTVEVTKVWSSEADRLVDSADPRINEGNLKRQQYNDANGITYKLISEVVS
jgi:hypothetical protein